MIFCGKFQQNVTLFSLPLYPETETNFASKGVDFSHSFNPLFDYKAECIIGWCGVPFLTL
jgi:hypothetical protein